MPPGLNSTLTAMGVDADSALLDSVIDMIGGSWAELIHLRQRSGTATDVSEMTDDELRACLAIRLRDPAADVVVAWPADRVAARMSGTQLLMAIDSLWYPAMDDLVVLRNDASGTTLLVLDHEERLTATQLH